MGYIVPLLGEHARVARHRLRISSQAGDIVTNGNLITGGLSSYLSDIERRNRKRKCSYPTYYLLYNLIRSFKTISFQFTYTILNS